MPAVLFLALLWAAVLVPVAWKAHSERKARFASSLGDGLQALEHAESFFPSVEAQDPPARSRPSAGPDPVAEPRHGWEQTDPAPLRGILGGLLSAVVVSLVAALVTSQRSMLAVHLVLDNCLLIFVAMLVLRRDGRARAMQRDLRPPAQSTPARPRASSGAEPRPAPAVYAAGVPVIAAPVVGDAFGARLHPRPEVPLVASR